MAQGIGYGSTLAFASGTGSPNTIGGIVDGWEVEAETEMVEVTLLGDATKKFMPADTDPGECTFEVALDNGDSDLTALKAAQAAGTLLSFTATYSNGGSADTFSGYVKTVGKTVKKREMLTSKITVKATGV